MMRLLALAPKLAVLSFLLFPNDAVRASSSLRRKRKTSAVTVAGIEDYFRKADNAPASKQVVDPLQMVDPLEWRAEQLSFDTDPPEALVPPTPSPISASDCEGVDREEAILEELSQLTPETQLLNSATPQGMAYQWILDVDPANVNACTEPARARQRYALATFYYSTGGDSWIDNEGWLSGDDECSWAKVVCHEGGGTVRKVSALMMSENNLSGEIPWEIQEFTELETLGIFNNELVGMLPDSMIELESMTMLDAEDNQLSGNPFTVLKNLRKLQNIRISNNLFVGELNDDSIENLEDLRELWIGGNRFRGELPGTIGNLKELETLYINDNEFSGALPTEMGELRLTMLHAQNNRFDGEIIDELFASIGLMVLRLDGNNFSGPLSEGVGDLSEIRDMRLGGNSLTTLPVTLFRLEKVEILGLSDNELEGPLMDSFDSLVALQTLDLADNNIGGPIPPSIFDAPNIRLVYLSKNALTGSIPSNWGSAQYLKDLYLDSNLLDGMIPPVDDGQVPDLSEFLLQDNDLTGDMPESICALRTPAGMLEDLWADCDDSSGPAEVTCSCCTQCVFDEERLL